MLLGNKWIKDCFVCHRKGHHLSRAQFAKVKADCKARLISAQKASGTRHPTVSEKTVMEKTWQHIENSKMLCNLCQGKRILIYPHN